MIEPTGTLPIAGDDDTALRRTPSQKRSRERVEHYFSWDSVARWTMDFYWDLVQG